MKSTIKLYLSVLILSACFNNVYSQTETTGLKFGYNLVENEPTIDFQFNRTSPSKAKDKYEIKFLKNSFAFNPSSEIHLGSGTKSSENNIILNLNTYHKNTFIEDASKKWTHLYKLNILSPQLSSDKDFIIYQAYAKFGAEYFSYYSRRDQLGFIEYSLGSNFEYGLSSIDTTNVSESVSRIKIFPTFQWQFWGKKSDDTILPEHDKDFYYRMDFKLSYIHYYFFEQDTRIIDDKSIGYFNFKLGYRFAKNFKLALEYKTGMMEPKFEKVDAFTIGVSIIN